MKFSVKDFFGKFGKILRKLRIYSHLLKKSLTENVIFFCPVNIVYSMIQFNPNKAGLF